MDDAPGTIGVSAAELPPLPDEIMTNPLAGRLDPRTWFKHPARPLEIEIGCGKGTFMVEQAPRSPSTNFLAIEWEYEFYLYTADRLRRRQVENVRVLHANAVDFLRWRVPDGIVSVIHLYYSDPWPKQKHHKNRVVQHGFLAEAWRVLRSARAEPGPEGIAAQSAGELRIVTDHDELWAWDVEHFNDWCATEDALTPGLRHTPAPGDELARVRATANPPFELAPFLPVEWAGDGGAVATNYEKKKTGAAADGKQPHACVLRKRG